MLGSVSYRADCSSANYPALRHTKQEFAIARTRSPARETRALPRRAERHAAFTVVELLVVMTIIIILAGLILATSGYVQKKGARARAEAEIAAMSAALESYKADNGVYPTAVAVTANHALYQALSGDGNDATGGSTASTGTQGSSGKNYMYLKSSMVSPNPPNASAVLRDPYGSPYNYLTPPGSVNPTFDLWSTGGTTNGDPNQWIKNW